jgi:hypothetical protein
MQAVQGCWEGFTALQASQRATGVQGAVTGHHASVAQLQAVLQACQAAEQLLPDQGAVNN